MGELRGLRTLRKVLRAVRVLRAKGLGRVSVVLGLRRSYDISHKSRNSRSPAATPLEPSIPRVPKDPLPP